MKYCCSFDNFKATNPTTYTLPEGSFSIIFLHYWYLPLVLNLTYKLDQVMIEWWFYWFWEALYFHWHCYTALLCILYHQVLAALGKEYFEFILPDIIRNCSHQKASVRDGYLTLFKVSIWIYWNNPLCAWSHLSMHYSYFYNIFFNKISCSICQGLWASSFRITCSKFCLLF